jgi:hypothetical protein
MNGDFMSAALKQAIADLAKKGCAAIFAGGMAKGHDPATVLQAIVNGTKYGSVAYSNMGAQFGAVTDERGGFLTARSVTVKINSFNDPSLGIYWNAGNDQVNATTLIHELGHAFNFLFGKNSSAIVDDYDKNGNPHPVKEKQNSDALKPCQQ